ncbi:MAG: hypothetical protein ACRD1Q_07900 [Vicinamibacterales bacterium]
MPSLASTVIAALGLVVALLTYPDIAPAMSRIGARQVLRDIGTTRYWSRTRGGTLRVLRQGEGGTPRGSR